MAANISVVNIGGRQIVEAMYANNPAWHGLGTVFDPGGDKAFTSEEAIVGGHLGWTTSLQELRTADGVTVKDYFGIRRDDTKDILGIVGKRYRPHQNVDAFKFLDGLQQDGVMKYESVMALKGGRRVVLLARMPQVDTVAEGDSSLRYICFAMGHDGGMGIFIMPTSVRVVCANTLALALESELKTHVKHTEHKDERLGEVAKWISQYNEKFTLFRDNAQKIASRQFNEDQAREYLMTLFPEPKADATDRVKRNHTNLLDSIYGNLQHPSNQIPSIKGSWWQLFNAVTYHVDHQGRYRVAEEVQNKDAGRAEQRFLDVMHGSGAKLKDEAFNLAVAAA